MNKPSTDFNKRSRQMLYARDARTKELVKLPGDINDDAVVYDDKIHKGHLICECCDTPVYFHQGSDVAKGSRQLGQSAHFKTYPNSSHYDDCKLAKPALERKASTAAFCFNFNTTSADYLAQPTDNNRPEDLVGYSLKGMFDLAAAMRTQEISRITNGYAVNREHGAAWRNFMWSDTDAACRRNMIETVHEMIAHKKLIQLCAMELRVDKTKIGIPFGIPEKRFIPGKAVKMYEDDQGVSHIIMPRFTVDWRITGKDGYEEILSFFDRSDTYMAQGLASLSSKKQGDARFYFPELAINDPAQLIKDSLKNLLAENHRHHARQAQPS